MLRYSIYLFAFFILFTSCNSDDEGNPVNTAPFPKDFVNYIELEGDSARRFEPDTFFMEYISFDSSSDAKPFFLISGFLKEEYENHWRFRNSFYISICSLETQVLDINNIYYEGFQFNYFNKPTEDPDSINDAYHFTIDRRNSIGSINIFRPEGTDYLNFEFEAEPIIIYKSDGSLNEPLSSRFYGKMVIPIDL